MKEEFIIDFECEVYVGRWTTICRHIATIVGSATTNAPPYLVDALGIDPTDTIADAVIEYCGLKDVPQHYVIARLQYCGTRGPSRDSRIWTMSIWGNP